MNMLRYYCDSKSSLTSKRDEKPDRLERLKAHQETDLCEIGIDNGIE